MDTAERLLRKINQTGLLFRHNLELDAEVSNYLSSSESKESAVADVLLERKRQIEVEGWTLDHDDQHPAGSLARAALCYAFAASRTHYSIRFVPPRFWPESWHFRWWKPKNPRRDLVRAAALIIAEIERIDRHAAPAAPEAAAQVGGDNSPASTHENARSPNGSPAAAAPELSEKQIEAWRAWLTTGVMSDLYCGTADQLCDMALRSLRGKEIAR